MKRTLPVLCFLLCLTSHAQVRTDGFAQGVRGIRPVYGLDFKGQATVGDYVIAPNSVSNNQLYQSTSLTLESWAVSRGLGLSTLGTFLSKAVGYSVRMNTGNTISVSLYDGAFKSTTTSTTINLNTLVHVVMTWESGSAPTIYLNGVKASYSATASVTTPGNDSANALFIGSNDGNRTFDGIIYATRIYRNKALSAAEVLTAYQAGRKAVSPVSGCTSQYLFNEGTGSSLLDSVGGINGTISGASWTNTP